jgi:hypothetical protein
VISLKAFSQYSAQIERLLKERIIRRFTANCDYICIQERMSLGQKSSDVRGFLTPVFQTF